MIRRETTPVYSAYILHSAGHWEEVAFKIRAPKAKKLTEPEIRKIALARYGGFACLDLITP
jgi:hypothetical protein